MFTYYKPTNNDIDGMTWKTFMAQINEQYWMITTDQWKTILGYMVSGRPELFTRVNELIDAKPVIGLTTDGYVIIRTGEKFDTAAKNTGVTWITNTWIGTPTGTEVTILTMDTTRELTKENRALAKKFWSLTIDELDAKNIPLIHFTHNRRETTRASYIYCDNKFRETPLPDGATFITGFNLVKGNKTNAIEAIDEKGRPYSGVFNLQSFNIEYDAITVNEPTPIRPTSGI